MYPKHKSDGPEILQISIISESDQLGIEKQITTKFLDSLHPFCAQFVVWSQDKFFSWSTGHAGDSKCTLSQKLMDPKFCKLASSVRATNWALKNKSQPSFSIVWAHFVLNLWYASKTRVFSGPQDMPVTQSVP